MILNRLKDWKAALILNADGLNSEFFGTTAIRPEISSPTAGLGHPAANGEASDYRQPGAAEQTEGEAKPRKQCPA
jgi:hypothetical protein